MAPAEENYICTQCGSNETEIVRKDPTNPRCKCNSCHFMFSGEDSKAASAAGAIQPSSAETLATATEPEVERLSFHEHSPIVAKQGMWAIPTKPSHVFIAKNRTEWEFVTKRDFKKTAMKWAQGGAYDVYELKAIKLQVDVSFQ